MSEYDNLDLTQLRALSRKDADNAADIHEHAAVLRELRDELQDKIDLMRAVVTPLLGKEAVTTGRMTREYRTVAWTGESARAVKREVFRLYESIEDTPDVMDHNARVLDELAVAVVETDRGLEEIADRAANGGEPSEADVQAARERVRTANEGYSVAAGSMRETRFYGGLREHAPPEPDGDSTVAGARPVGEHPANGQSGEALPPSGSPPPGQAPPAGAPLSPGAGTPPVGGPDAPELQNPASPAPMPPAPPLSAPTPAAPPPVGGVPAIPAIPPPPGTPVRPVIPGATRPVATLPGGPNPPAGSPPPGKPAGTPPPPNPLAARPSAPPRPVTPPVIGSRPGGPSPYGLPSSAPPRVPNPNGTVRPVIGGRTRAEPKTTAKATSSGRVPPKRKRGKLDPKAGRRAPRAADGKPAKQEVFVRFTRNDRKPAQPEARPTTDDIWFDTTDTVPPVIRGARRTPPPDTRRWIPRDERRPEHDVQ